MKNRIPNRLKGYDYSFPGFYFVTINIKDRLPVFGNVLNSKMVLNEFGEIAQQCWEEIPNHFSNTIIDEYIIMSNHVHGIIEISAVGAGHARPLRKTRTLRGINHLTNKNNCSKIKQMFNWNRFLT